MGLSNENQLNSHCCCVYVHMTACTWHFNKQWKALQRSIISAHHKETQQWELGDFTESSGLTHLFPSENKIITWPAVAAARPEPSPRCAAARPASGPRTAGAGRRRAPGCAGRGGRTTPDPEQTRGHPLHRGATPPPGPERPPRVAWTLASGSQSSGGTPNPVEDTAIFISLSVDLNQHFKRTGDLWPHLNPCRQDGPSSGRWPEREALQNGAVETQSC